MSVLYALAWRLLHVVLAVQRGLVAWLRLWHWRIWRALGSLLVPADIGFHDRRTQINCKCLHRRRDHRELTGKYGCPVTPDSSYLPHRCDCTHLHRDLILQKRDRAKLTKLPVHLGLLIAEEQESYTDVASLVVWCMALGVSYVSVFDHQGIFKQNTSRLMDEVLKQQKELQGEECSTYPLEYVNGSTDKKDKAFGHFPLLRVLSPEDGKPHIVKSAQHFCQLVADRRKRPADLDVDEFDNLLRRTQDFPDPDLILKFGPVNSMLGFLPWHIRLSEIISLPTHVNIQYEDFFFALCCYAGCEQRFGK